MLPPKNSNTEIELREGKVVFTLWENPWREKEQILAIDMTRIYPERGLNTCLLNSIKNTVQTFSPDSLRHRIMNEMTLCISVWTPDRNSTMNTLISVKQIKSISLQFVNFIHKCSDTDDHIVHITFHSSNIPLHSQSSNSKYWLFIGRCFHWVFPVRRMRGRELIHKTAEISFTLNDEGTRLLRDRSHWLSSGRISDIFHYFLRQLASTGGHLQIWIYYSSCTRLTYARH